MVQFNKYNKHITNNIDDEMAGIEKRTARGAQIVGVRSILENIIPIPVYEELGLWPTLYGSRAEHRI